MQAQWDGIPDIHKCELTCSWCRSYTQGCLHPGMPWIKAGVPTSQPRKLHPLQCCVRPVSIHVPLVHKSTIASLARCLVSAVDFATKVCFSLFAGSEVLASGMKGKCAMCGASERLRLLASSCCALWEVPEGPVQSCRSAFWLACVFFFQSLCTNALFIHTHPM